MRIMIAAMDTPDALGRRSLLITASIFTAIGALFSGLLLAQIVPDARLLAHTVGMTATYVGDVERTRGLNGGTFVYPRFRFRAEDGSMHEATSTAGATQESYAEGDTVRIRYDPARPDRAVVWTFWTIMAGPLFCTVFILGFGVPGILMLRHARAHQRGTRVNPGEG